MARYKVYGLDEYDIKLSEIESLIAYAEDTAAPPKASSYPITFCKSIKQTTATALSKLTADTLLLVSGISDFSDAIRYETLASLGF